MRMKATMVITLIRANQNSNSPKLATVQALAASRPNENTTTQSHPGTWGNQKWQ